MRTSAQDTVLGQAVSSLAFILSMTLNPLAEFAFGAASFSVLNDVELSRRIDASQPYKTIVQYMTIVYIYINVTSSFTLCSTFKWYVKFRDKKKMVCKVLCP